MQNIESSAYLGYRNIEFSKPFSLQGMDRETYHWRPLYCNLLSSGIFHKPGHCYDLPCHSKVYKIHWEGCHYCSCYKCLDLDHKICYWYLWMSHLGKTNWLSSIRRYCALKRKRKQGAVTVFTWASKDGMSVIDNVLVNMVVKNIPFKECYHASHITVFMR